jgi:uncharacterized protein YdhG (YjbR/CyaY superfamily)
MKPSKKSLTPIDAYIKSFPADVQKKLETMRQAIRSVAPEATEAISYRIPTFKLNGNLVHFAAFKHHIGFYPTSSGTKAFQKELSPYHCSKGAVRFPLDQPIPLALVKQITRFRVGENQTKKSQSSKTVKASIQPTIAARHIAPCGMDCHLCMAYLRDQKHCPGCRGSDATKAKTCVNCVIKNCPKLAKDKRLFCTGCDIFPCARLKHLDQRYRTKYEMSMLDNLEYIRKHGLDKFVEHEHKRWIKGDKIYCVHRHEYRDLKSRGAS